MMVDKVKLIVEHSTIWGLVLMGWLSVLQPILTVIATVLAICWTARQLYLSWTKKNSKNN
jgi:hypothetical protein